MKKEKMTEVEVFVTEGGALFTNEYALGNLISKDYERSLDMGNVEVTDFYEAVSSEPLPEGFSGVEVKLNTTDNKDRWFLPESVGKDSKGERWQHFATLEYWIFIPEPALVKYEWVMGTWAVTSAAQTTWTPHPQDDDLEDPLREELLNTCRANDAWEEVSVERDLHGKVTSFTFEPK